ncbi:hypothetical protein [Cohnella terricola]|nr:hypothetical protein [Cohnella terricola]
MEQQITTFVETERASGMNLKTIVHFGAGALGRGMVVPLLFESGYEVVVLDTNEELNRELNREGGYRLKLSDDQSGDGEREIRIREALSPVADRDRVAEYLKSANVVTTSVRRENLVHVARALAETWGELDGENRMVICCENIENVGSLFRSLLVEAAASEEQSARLRRIAVPDTIVDRICTANWPEGTNVVAETFHECSVDANEAPQTGITLIPSVARIERDFARKRLLLNTYADAISFLAKGEGKTYLFEAARSDDINRMIEPYMALLQEMLKLEYDCDSSELQEWRSKYKSRLSNSGIPRELDTVARNLWAKLDLNERFAWPLIKLQEHGVDIGEGAKFLAKLVRTADGEGQSAAELQAKLEGLWGTTPAGRKLCELVSERLGE